MNLQRKLAVLLAVLASICLCYLPLFGMPEPSVTVTCAVILAVCGAAALGKEADLETFPTASNWPDVALVLLAAFTAIASIVSLIGTLLLGVPIGDDCRILWFGSATLVVALIAVGIEPKVLPVVQILEAIILAGCTALVLAEWGAPGLASLLGLVLSLSGASCLYAANPPTDSNTNVG